MVVVTGILGIRYYTISQDKVPPTTSQNYETKWHTSNFSITLSATDSETGVAETYYRINAGEIKTVRTNGQPQIAHESENNTLEFWSTDNAGNTETTQILSEIMLDKTAPTIDDPLPNPNPSKHAIMEGQEVQVAVEISDSLSGIESVILSYTIDQKTNIWENLSMTLNSTTQSWQATIPGQEIWTYVIYKIVASDIAGNVAVSTGGYILYGYQTVPEFPSWIMVPLFVTATIVLATYRRKTNPG